MKTSPLQRLLEAGESEQVVFAAAPADLMAIGKTVCALLNADGGTLILGVDEGRVVGVRDAEETKTGIQEHLLDKISPKALWSIGVEELDGHETVVVDVPQGLEAPYLYDDRIYVRHGREVRSASPSDITLLVQKRHGETVRWERLPALGFSMSDLDSAEILRTADEGARHRLYPFQEPDSPETVLEDLNLSSQGSILNGALVLFGRSPGRRYPQLRVRLARYDETGKLIDSRLLEGNVFVLFEQIQAFFRDYVPIASEFPEKTLQRTDSPAYPWIALREGVINALAHREYASFDGGVFVSMYWDRIEIWNSGTLPEGMTVRDLKEERISRLRNPDIAHVLWLRRFIEGFGSGSGKILTECQRAGLPEPEWKVGAGGVSLTLRSTLAESETPTSASQTELNVRQQMFLAEIQPGTRIGSAEYSRRFATGVTQRQAREDLARLTDAGYLRREGKGPSTVYVRTRKT